MILKQKRGQFRVVSDDASLVTSCGCEGNTKELIGQFAEIWLLLLLNRRKVSSKIQATSNSHFRLKPLWHFKILSQNDFSILTRNVVEETSIANFATNTMHNADSSSTCIEHCTANCGRLQPYWIKLLSCNPFEWNCFPPLNQSTLNHDRHSTTFSFSPLCRNRSWYIQATCATSGDGLYEGLDWLSNQLKNANR